jgi:hypothetical protein
LLNDTSKPHSASKNEGSSPQQEDHEAERGNTATEGTRCAEMAAPDRQILLTNPDARSMATSGRDNNIWDEPMEWLQYRFITKWAAYSDTVGFGLGIQQRRKLRMAAGAPVINDLLPSRAPGPHPRPRSCSIIASARSIIPAKVHTGPSMMRIRSSSILRF